MSTTRKYIKQKESALILPPSATKLATTCPQGIYVGIKTTTPWQLSETNKDPPREDPIAGPFLSLEDAFETSVLCSRILLDYFKLPPDSCQLIATAIEKGTAIAVCDGSFHPKDHLGTAAFLMVASKKDK